MRNQDDTEIASTLLATLREIVREEVRAEVRAALASKPEPPPADEMLTVRQAASIAGVRPETIRDWVRAGRLKALRVGKPRRRGSTKSAAIRILRRELDAALRPRVDTSAAGLSAYERGRRDANQLLTRGT